VLCAALLMCYLINNMNEFVREAQHCLVV
jgi:hypothetical protein